METVNFLLDRPLALLVVLAIGALIGVDVERLVAGIESEKRKAYWRGRNADKGKRGKGGGKVVSIGEPETQAADFAAQ